MFDTVDHKPYRFVKIQQMVHKYCLSIRLEGVLLPFVSFYPLLVQSILLNSTFFSMAGKILHVEHIELLTEEYKQLKKEVAGKELVKGTLHFTGQ